eukprot:GHVL01003045.1.p1 GENE.GHVL01003045.1~~GHVL01003045.1.p1  ORF type:complete len:219 (+),score=100.17 GHVL01003045.1:33-659(+)
MSLGWLTESSLICKPSKSIEGLTDASLVDLRSVVAKEENEAKRRIFTKNKKPKKKIKKKDVMSDTNIGVELRDARDREIFKEEEKNFENSKKKMIEKCNIYEKMMNNEKIENNEYLVDFTMKKYFGKNEIYKPCEIEKNEKCEENDKNEKYDMNGYVKQNFDINMSEDSKKYIRQLHSEVETAKNEGGGNLKLKLQERLRQLREEKKK